MMQTNQILCGDATSQMSQLAAASVDLIVADPPYNLGKNYGNNVDRKTREEYHEFTKNWLTQAVRILRPEGSIYVFMGVRFISRLFLMMKRISA